MAGCGGSSDDGTATSAAAGGDDFVAQANAICTEADEKYTALGDVSEFESTADFEDRFGQLIEIATQQYTDIEELGPPPADIAESVQEYLVAGGASVAATQELYDRVLGGEDIEAAREATIDSEAGVAVSTSREEAATAAGLDACETS